MSEWNPDPQVSYFGHPRLFAGYNSWENDGDEVDGPGVNEAQWPAFLDSFIPLRVMVMTADMLAAFTSQCPDFTAPAEPHLYVTPHDDWSVTAGAPWFNYVAPAEPGSYDVEPANWGLTFAADWPDYVVAPENSSHVSRRWP